MQKGVPFRNGLLPLPACDSPAAVRGRAGIPRDCLQGLEGYSHCWLLYVFHENTDLGRLWRTGVDGDRGLKGKVGVSPHFLDGQGPNTASGMPC